MTDFSLKTYADIDWTVLRENALKKKGWQNKNAKEWDGKARSFAGRNKSSAYIELFLSHLPLQQDMTVLDIGSGPGTLALPIAKKVKSVTAVDFSRSMLDTLEELAGAERIGNINTVHCAWEDDWQARGIQPHDIAIASRAMGVKDLKAALEKINAFALQYVFLSDRIGVTPFEIGAFEALGRPFAPGPDYIYTLNILYTLGIHANVMVLRLEQDVSYSSMDEAVASYSWMFHDITPPEMAALEHYISRQTISSDADRLTVRRATPPQWALIWWQKDQTGSQRATTP
ncbi:MAG: hypothetical protein VR65_16225 [Desulfobulbaceae bacterium BRH_c16a]|nr:MAG: hypothetical protein VR65_16225 [Desulfobulbaceae bacterium BRH_c16a]